MIRQLGKYKNGNYTVKIFEDGTKIRELEEGTFHPQFAENIDLKITNRCTGANCPFCHEGSSSTGKHADILKEDFIYTLKPYQEVAIGGGNVLEHPDLVALLHILKKQKVITNITVNQIHFEQNQEFIQRLVKENLIYGLGISLSKPTKELIQMVKDFPNAVVHVIAGLVTEKELDALSNQNIKLLILGYKKLRRGERYYKAEAEAIQRRLQWLRKELSNYVGKFHTISFDNLALEQLEIKEMLTEEEWEEFYMGEDASFTYYIDAVERTFARSSTAPENEKFKLLNDATTMFQTIRNGKEIR